MKVPQNQVYPYRGIAVRGSFGHWIVPPLPLGAGWEQVRDHAAVVGYLSGVQEWVDSLMGVGQEVDVTIMLYLEKYHPDLLGSGKCFIGTTEKR